MKKYLKLLPILAAGLTAMGIKNVTASERSITFMSKKFKLNVNLQ